MVDRFAHFVRSGSTNPGLVPNGAGEGRSAVYVAEAMEERETVGGQRSSVHWPTRENVADRPEKTLQSGTRRGSVRTGSSDSTLILDSLLRAMSDRLTSRQRAHLRSLAHDQDPLVHIGKEGLTDAVEQSIEEAFHTRELVTIRVLDNAPREVRDVAEAAATGLDDVQVVRTIGSTALLYRPHPDEPEITLPDPGGE